MHKILTLYTHTHAHTHHTCPHYTHIHTHTQTHTPLIGRNTACRCSHCNKYPMVYAGQEVSHVSIEIPANNTTYVNIYVRMYMHICTYILLLYTYPHTSYKCIYSPFLKNLVYSVPLSYHLVL